MRRIVMTLLLALTPAFAGAGTAQAQEAKDASSEAAKDATPAATEQWTPLFNGQDLAGWGDVMDNASSWQVTGGVIEGRGGGQGQPGVLVADRQDYVNFRLRAQFCYRQPGDGGTIEVRRSSPAEGVSSSYRVSAHLNPNRMRGVRPPGNVLRCRVYRYGTAEPQARAATPIKAEAGRWHTLEIQVTGNTVTTYVNGRKADEFTDSKRAFTTGGIALVCRGDSAVLYREVSIIELPE